ncbi:tubulin polyglutamylase TTLL7-like [Ostrea edulis]|uniref:tubulin polyglutamylase TTLL7-like n=1 Tax=Ostrea edulis TaxID=37623 RepID=UPI0020958DF4|nr:tubulin polyglutamylase TTLL7-like [Ostrea edulis]XP_048759053.1 tubulin polyglutamylase TTLL7-like [Ostrea edulis]XP_048759054.1 tubulin polyglutamylase TTLL7-like [Ostrea edulis]
MPGVKPSASLTSLMMDKQDVTLTSLTQYARRPGATQSSLLQGARQAPPDEKRNVDNEDKKAVQAPKKKRKKKHGITANLSGTRYEVIRIVCEKCKFDICKEDDPNSYLIWSDSFVSADRITEMKPFQRINHFPGMVEVTRKDCLARNMMKVQRHHADEFNFVPKTWILPADHSMLLNYAKDLKAKKKYRTFIVKPSNGAQGHGIQLYKNAEKIPPSEHFIVQEYIDKPLLLEGYKFDLRIYVLVTSCDPLRIFIFNDGLVRMSTDKYINPSDGNLSNLYMHLTNYSVNKHNEYYQKGDSVDTGSKRSIRYFNDYLRKNDYDIVLLWRRIYDMVVKTLLVAHPHLLHAYRMCRPGAPAGSDSVCFEVLGFDVLIDRKLNPWLLEINRSPSFGTDEKIDFDIKSALIEDTIRLLNIKLSDKRRNYFAQKAEAQKRLFRTTKRNEADMTELEKKKQSIEKRREELKEHLARVRKATAREDFENRNAGRFRRIFPSEDKLKQQKYVNIMSSIFGIVMSGRAPAMQKEIQKVYNNQWREEDILDMIAECEADDKDGKLTSGGSKIPRGPKPLSSMPISVRSPPTEDEFDEEEEEEEAEYTSPPGSPNMNRRESRPPSTKSRPGSLRPDSRVSNDASSLCNSRPNSGVSSMRSRPVSNMSALNSRSKSLSRLHGKQSVLQRSIIDDNFLITVVKEREDELTKKTLLALSDMRIKFPGKTDQEAELILDTLHENWKFHKPRIASYWLVKLDSIKRRKVIDIVRSNVRAVLQRIWRISDVDNLRLYRIFTRVFNRLLWSHGQGLWNCFSTTSQNGSWETIFSKSSENICENEFNCCRRIVQLCRDCLLIVYQFAAEAKSSSQQNSENSELSSAGTLSSRDKSSSTLVAPLNTQTMSQRYSKLYPRADTTAT